MRLILSLTVFFLAASVASGQGRFQPYEIKAGISYYSDEYTAHDGVSVLGEEKNLEEVYQNYNYYEAVFDSQERIVVFKAYERGTLEFSEEYYYGEGEEPIRKIVKNSDGSESAVDF